jgi:hypothetical protein
MSGSPIPAISRCLHVGSILQLCAKGVREKLGQAELRIIACLGNRLIGMEVFKQQRALLRSPPDDGESQNKQVSWRIVSWIFSG